MKIGTNDFARRQTPDSKYSHFAGTWDELVELVSAHFNGSEEGVVAVSVPPEDFFSGVTDLSEESNLHAQYAARRRGEDPYVQLTVVGGKKLPAKSVQIIVYSHETLAKDDDASTDAEWEIVSINASAVDGSEPPTPVAMARNFLTMAGGTKRDYSAQQFAEAIVFWSQHAMIE